MCQSKKCLNIYDPASCTLIYKGTALDDSLCSEVEGDHFKWPAISEMIGRMLPEYLIMTTVYFIAGITKSFKMMQRSMIFSV